MKIEKIEIENYKCFEELFIDCRKEDGSLFQWTVLLGNNNTGKTSLLKAIAKLRPVILKSNKIQSSDNGILVNVYVPALIYDEEEHDKLSPDTVVGCTVVALDTKQTFVWNYKNDLASMTSESDIVKLRMYGYGVSRYPSKTSLSESGCEDCASLFSSEQRLVNIEEWLMQLDYAVKSKNILAKERLERVRELLCGKLFPEILDFKFDSSEGLQHYVLFQTKDGWFRYTQLGYGYQSMLSWVVDLCKRMFERYPESNNPLKESAIVLIDEIDLHLHPMWQRDIISFLSKSFPNVQFIATTHSPLVIQSMNDVNLYVLHRENDKVIAERSNVSNYQGWTVEEILRDTMKMDSDIHSDKYQKYIRIFDEGLDENDKNKVSRAYDVLCKMLHPENPVKRLLEFQRSQMTRND